MRYLFVVCCGNANALDRKFFGTRGADVRAGKFTARDDANQKRRRPDQQCPQWDR